MSRSGTINTVVGIIGVVLTLVTVLFGDDLVERFAPKVITAAVADTEWVTPPDVQITPSTPGTVLPDRFVTFTFSNDTNTTCERPLFRLTVSGTIARLDISDTKEKKDFIQQSVTYDKVVVDRDTVRFESQRLARGSFISGLVWYKSLITRHPVKTDISSDNGFELRQFGEEKSSSAQQWLLVFAALLAAISSSLLRSSLPAMGEYLGQVWPWSTKHFPRTTVAMIRDNKKRFDFVGRGLHMGPSGTPDWWISVVGIDPSKLVQDIEIRSPSGGVWRSWTDRHDKPGNWIAVYCDSEQFRKDPYVAKLHNLNGKTQTGLSKIELFFEPHRAERENEYSITVSYADGTHNDWIAT